ncbi:MAG: YggT family protein [Acidimicrobiales bacterium]
MGTILCNLILIYTVVLFGRIVLSWFPVTPGSAMESVSRVLGALTDPVLEPLRRVLPPVGGMLDLSPLVVFIALAILRSFVCA